jgi:hypothetical protein
MDLDVIAKQVRELVAFKTKYEPLLAKMLPEFEKHMAAEKEPAAEETAPE